MKHSWLFVLLTVIMSGILCAGSTGSASKGSDLEVRSAYSLDVVNFMNVLTGDPFYAQVHSAAFELWYQRLSEQSKQALQSLAQAVGDNPLGPMVSHVVSSIDGFEELSPTAIFGDPQGLLQDYYNKYADGKEEFSYDQALGLAEVVGMVISELEQKGFREYWIAERLPLIEQERQKTLEFLSSRPLAISAEVAAMLGEDLGDGDEKIRLYLCSFAAPHGMRLAGKAFATDISFGVQTNLRIAIHEMFHPPFHVEDLGEDYSALLNDPFFITSFAEHSSTNFGYPTPEAFLEENIVEAMELHVSHKLGLIADPIAHLLAHDNGDHKLSFVLVKYFNQVTRDEGETFGAYFRRLIRNELPLGQLDRIYEEQVTRR